MHLFTLFINTAPVPPGVCRRCVGNGVISNNAAAAKSVFRSAPAVSGQDWNLLAFGRDLRRHSGARHWSRRDAMPWTIPQVQ